ncbi:hypothetical protein evm_002238 [Chilo suppressalis]|nr:hypothetical protein evm_002238 [Chilo suppressalis]
MMSNDDLYYYVLVRQLLYWQHAYENCKRMNGSLAAVDSGEVLMQLLLAMGENKEEPIRHIWISGRLRMTKEQQSDSITYTWYNPSNGKTINDPNNHHSPGANTYPNALTTCAIELLKAWWVMAQIPYSIHREDLCPRSGDINGLMMMMMMIMMNRSMVLLGVGLRLFCSGQSH